MIDLKRTTVSTKLMIAGDRLDPELVTKKLCINPTRYWHKGDVLPRHKKPVAFSFWVYGTGEEESMNINTQLLKLYDQMKGKEKVLKELREEFGLRYTIGVVPRIKNNDTPAMHFDRWFIDFVQEIGAGVDIDLYIST